MAVASGLGDGAMPMPMLCRGHASGPLLGGMLPMYLLMCVFHLPPWLRRMHRR